MVRDANKLEKLVKKKEGLQNWLDYYENKQARHPEMMLTTKVLPLCIYLIVNTNGFGHLSDTSTVGYYFIDWISRIMGKESECSGIL